MSIYKNYFPIFLKNKNLIYFDSAGTNLKVSKFIRATNNYYNNFSINLHTNTNHKMFASSYEVLKNCKKIIKETIKGNEGQIIFFPSSTYSINIIALSLEKYLNGGEILLTKLEHSSNIYPWQKISLKNEIKIDYLPLNEDLTINLKKIQEKITYKTKLVSIAHVNNSLGIVNDIEEITNIIKKKNPECLILVDASQSINYLNIDAKKWKIDFLIFSGHKVFGPSGLSVAWIREKTKNKLEKIIWGGGDKKGPFEYNNDNNTITLVDKFETGSLAMCQIFGLKACFDFIKKFRKNNNWEKKIKELTAYAFRKLKENSNNLEIYNKEEKLSSIILFNVKNVHPQDVSNYLGVNNIIVRPGNFCCPFIQETLNIKRSGAIRMSFSIYNEKKDVDVFISKLKALLNDPLLILNI